MDDTPSLPPCRAVGKGRKSISYGDSLSCTASRCALRVAVDCGGIAWQPLTWGTVPTLYRFRMGDSWACVLQLQLLILEQPEDSTSMPCHSSDQKRTERDTCPCSNQKKVSFSFLLRGEFGWHLHTCILLISPTIHPLCFPIGPSPI